MKGTNVYYVDGQYGIVISISMECHFSGGMTAGPANEGKNYDPFSREFLVPVVGAGNGLGRAMVPRVIFAKPARSD